MRIELPAYLANIVQEGNPTAKLLVFVNGQYMPPELGYCYGVGDDGVAIKFEGLGETLGKLTELAKTMPQLAPLTDSNMLQVSIIVMGHSQWHYKDGQWTQR